MFIQSRMVNQKATIYVHQACRPEIAL